MKKHVLFITEKWCDAKPTLGLTNSFHNFFNTFSQTQPDYEFNTLHLDECSVVYGKKIDDVLLNYCSNFKCDILIFCLLGNSPMNPSKDTIKKLKDLGKKICVLWPDTGPSWGINTIQVLDDVIDLNVSIDYPIGPHISSYQKKDNHLFLWTPEDINLYYRPKEKDIDISFLGSKIYRDRSSYLTELSKQFPSMIIGGGQREQKLTPEVYAQIVRRSKIGINFSLSPTMVFTQLKGRTLEYIASGSLLLEDKNLSTEAFFTPGTDYVQFESIGDLVEKIKYYLEHTEERIKIANSGYVKYWTNYHPKTFWDKVLEKLK